jgi:hypothetical protein
MSSAETSAGIATSLSLFDILPFPALIVDDEIKIFQYNPAALRFLKSDHASTIEHRTGDVLHCLHSLDSEGGCGQGPFCKNCLIRGSIVEALQGSGVTRKRAKLDVKIDGNTEKLYALITALPLPYGAIPLVLLLIEDVREIAELQRLIPMCSKCRKIRDEKRAWVALESYFKTTWDVDFSHGYCPDCLKEEMGLLEEEGRQKADRRQTEVRQKEEGERIED